MLMAFFSWWYGPGWKQVAGNLLPRLRNVADSFSVSQLSRTLFAPWKRIVTNPGRSLEDKLQAWADNMFSRFIGFLVRFFVLVAATVCLMLVGILSVIELVIWPLLPLAIPGFIIAGATL